VSVPVSAEAAAVNGWRALAPAKINLGLFVGPQRADGRHELVSVMQSISLADELTLELAQPGASADELLCPDVPTLERENLAGEALARFRAASGWSAPPLRLTLRKRVPVAAGLGGGSGDAAATLRLAAAAAGIEDEALLLSLAAELGADVPAQVSPGRWLALGAGERLEHLPAPTEPFGVAVLPLDAQLSTAAVYAEADRLGTPRSDRDLRWLAAAVGRELATGKQLPDEALLANDLQRAAIALCPAIEQALSDVTALGADVAFVSGSGPTALGLFAGADGPARSEGAVEALLARHPRAVAAVPIEADFARPRPVRNNDSRTQ
jgi:4-diphosphocytidyl-2-C-methyl-D-erythritol kinase